MIICRLVAILLSAMWHLNFMWQRWVVGGLGWMWNREYLPCNPKTHHDNEQQMSFSLWFPSHCQWYVTSIPCEVNEWWGVGTINGGVPTVVAKIQNNNWHSSVIFWLPHHLKQVAELFYLNHQSYTSLKVKFLDNSKIIPWIPSSIPVLFFCKFQQ